MLTFSNGWVLGELRHPSSQCSSTATIKMYSGIEPLQRLVPRNAKQLNGIWAIEKFQLPYPSSMVWQLNSRQFWFGTRTIDLQRAHDIQSDIMSAPTMVRTLCTVVVTTMHASTPTVTDHQHTRDVRLDDADMPTMGPALCWSDCLSL